MITKFRVQNYKALRDVSLKLTPIHVLIGPNDSGKTSLLEALGAFCRSVDSELVAAFRGPWEGRELVWCRIDEAITFTGHFHGGLAYQVGCEFTPIGRNVSIVNDAAGINGKTIGLPRGERGLSCLASIRLRGKPVFFSRDQQDEIDAVNSINRECVGVHSFRWVPGMLSLPSALDPSRSFRMDESGFGLATCLDDIIGHDIDLFQKLEARFLSFFPDIRAVTARYLSWYFWASSSLPTIRAYWL